MTELTGRIGADISHYLDALLTGLLAIRSLVCRETSQLDGSTARPYRRTSKECPIMSFTADMADTFASYERDAFIRSTISSAGFILGNAT